MSLSTIGVNAPNHFTYTKKKEVCVAKAFQKAFPALQVDTIESYIKDAIRCSIALSPIDLLAGHKMAFGEEFENTRLTLSLVMTDEDRSHIEKLTGLTSSMMCFDDVASGSMHDMFSNPLYNEKITQQLLHDHGVVDFAESWANAVEDKISTPSKREVYLKRDKVAIDALWMHLGSLVEEKGEHLSLDELGRYLTLEGFAEIALRYKSKAMGRLITSVGGILALSLSEYATQPEVAIRRFNAIVEPVCLMLSIQFGLFHAFCRTAKNVEVSTEIMKFSAVRIKAVFEKDHDGILFSYNKCIQALSVGLFGCSFEEAKAVHLPKFTAPQAKCSLQSVLRLAGRMSLYNDLMGVENTDLNSGMLSKARLNDRLMAFATTSILHDDEWSKMLLGRSKVLSVALCQCLAYRQAEQGFIVSYKNVLKAHSVDEVVRMVENYDIPLEGNALLVDFIDSLPLRWNVDGTIDKEASTVGFELLSLHLQAGIKYLRFLSLFSKLSQ
tara:strand:- start:1612 stop:3102 length:1491 start_codon:yes stop_codon:yes gene_type:complete